MNRSFRIALCFLCLSCWPLHQTLAQTNGASSSGSNQEAAKPAQQESSAEKEKREQDRPKKVFKPSEEISEDSPVPFPVDI